MTLTTTIITARATTTTTKTKQTIATPTARAITTAPAAEEQQLIKLEITKGLETRTLLRPWILVSIEIGSPMVITIKKNLHVSVKNDF